MLRAEKEYEATMVRFHEPVRAPLNQALCMAATGLQEARKDHTEKARRTGRKEDTGVGTGEKWTRHWDPLMPC